MSAPALATLPEIIDAHQHFWDPEAGEYAWMSGDDMAPLRRVFGPADLFEVMAHQGVGACITVQCRHDLDETFEFLRQAQADPRIVGVVGWVDLTSSDVSRDLARLQASPGGGRLIGIRHLTHNESDADWLTRPDVMRGIAAVFAAGLAFDLLVRTRELAAAITLVSNFPQGRFILDHMAKPAIGSQVDSSWAEGIKKIASYPQVWCKLSGLVTEVVTSTRTSATFLPYIAHVLSHFGASRVIYGSDWPVCLLRASYADVLGVAKQAIAQLTNSKSDRAAIFGLNAVAAYALKDMASDSRHGATSS